MTYTPTPEAVEAAAKRLAAVAASYGADGGAEAWRTWTEEARAALTAAGPIIAAEVRGQREAFLPSDTLDPAWVAGWRAAVDHVAAHIESGGRGRDGRAPL